MKEKNTRASLRMLIPIICICMVAAIAIVLVLDSSNTIQGIKPNAEGKYEITSAEQLQYLAQIPNGSFVLKEDLDMSGVAWTPVPSFSGTLDGGNKTISNLVLSESVRCGSEVYAMGLFAELTDTAVVENLHLCDTVINADGKAQFVGMLAGISSGTVTGCTVSGEINDSRKALASNQSADTNIYLGGLIGKVAAGTVTPGTSLTYTDEVGNTTEGLCANVAFFVPDSASVMTGLVASNLGAPITGYWRDYSNTSQKLSPVIQQRQQIVVDYMYQMGTVEWTPTADLSYVTKDHAESSLHYQEFKAGKTYKGIPYTGLHGSLQRFMACLDEDGKVVQWVNDLGTESRYRYDASGATVGFDGFAQYIGNDCSGAVYWAWLQISPSEVSNSQRGVRVNYTQQMVPNESYSVFQGIYPVGQYDSEKHTFSTAAYEVTDEEYTMTIVSRNGLDTIYEAYAQAHKADALLYWKDSGHCRLLALDPIVIRDADGAISREMSYVITHEQGDGLSDWDGVDPSEKYSWRLNYKITFHELIVGLKNAKGSGAAYIPITIAALHDEEVPAPYVSIRQELTAANCGTLYSNYRIVSTRLEVLVNGDTVYDRVGYTGIDSDGYTMLGQARDGNTYSQLFYLEDAFADALDGVASGQEYTYKLTVSVSNGTELTATEDGTVLTGTFTKP